MRLQERPRFKLSCGVAFDDFARRRRGGPRALAVGAQPRRTAACSTRPSPRSPTPGPPGKALLVLGFESAHHPVDEPMQIALEVARDHGGEPGRSRRARRREAQPAGGAAREPAGGGRGGSDPVGAWRHAFLAAPYLRDTFVALGVLSDTFETAITWDRFAEFHADGDRDGAARRRRGVRRAAGRPGIAPAHLPLHPRLPGRAGALLHGPRPRAAAAARSSSGTRSRPRCPRR